MEQFFTERSAPALSHARSLFLRGFYKQSIAQLLVLPAEPEQLLALLRAYLRVGKFDEAARCMVAARGAGRCTDPAAALLSSAMEIFAHASLGMKVDRWYALSLREQAQQFTGRLRDDVEYHVAGALFITGDYTHAEQIMTRRIEPGLYAGNDLFLGRFHLLQCWLHAARRDYKKQATSLMKALSFFLQSAERDVGLCAITAQGLCGLARDIYLPEAIKIVVDAEPVLEGPPRLGTSALSNTALTWVDQGHARGLHCINSPHYSVCSHCCRRVMQICRSPRSGMGGEDV